MKPYITFLLILLCASMLSFLTSCANYLVNKDHAYQYCVDNGNQIKTEFINKQSTDFCVFKDNSYCNKWGYYNGSCKPGENKSPIISMPAKNQMCIQNFGTNKVFIDNNKVYHICVFKDGYCDINDLVKGKCMKNKQNNKALKQSKMSSSFIQQLRENCSDKGGEVQTMSYDNLPIETCVLKNQQICGLYDLYQNKCIPGKIKLN